jgi:hypothetical protein
METQLKTVTLAWSGKDVAQIARLLDPTIKGSQLTEEDHVHAVASLRLWHGKYKKHVPALMKDSFFKTTGHGGSGKLRELMLAATSATGVGVVDEVTEYLAFSTEYDLAVLDYWRNASRFKISSFGKDCN